MTRTGPRFGDCFVDPGPLSGDAAILTLGIHHACPAQCRPQQRAVAALDAEYTATTLPLTRPTQDDSLFAERLREAARLTEDRP